MAERAVRGVLERLFLALHPPEMGGPIRGSLLVTLVAEGPRCTVTVAAAGELGRASNAETLREAPPGVLELPGVPRAPPPCCTRVLRRARLRFAFQLCPPPGTLSPDCVTLRRFLHRTSVAHPEVEFHFCVSLDGAVASHTYSPETPWVLAGAWLRVQSRHFVQPVAPGGASPPCGRIHPTAGTPVRLRLPPAAAAAGLGGELSLVPVAAFAPCLRPTPTLPTRLTRVAVFLYDPAGLPAPPSQPPQFFQDPSWLADWERFGFSLTPGAPSESKEELVTPDVIYVSEGGEAPPDHDGHPQTLLLFLFLRHDDPFQPYDAATRRLLLAHLHQLLAGSRAALARGLGALLHPALRRLRRHLRDQEIVARALPVAVAAVTSVVAASTSAGFRQACLRAMEVEDTPALVAATRRSLAEVAHRRGPPCETPRRGSSAGQRGRQEEEEEEEDAGPQSSEGEVWQREVAGLAEWTA